MLGADIITGAGGARRSRRPGGEGVDAFYSRRRWYQQPPGQAFPAPGDRDGACRADRSELPWPGDSNAPAFVSRECSRLKISLPSSRRRPSAPGLRASWCAAGGWTRRSSTVSPGGIGGPGKAHRQPGSSLERAMENFHADPMGLRARADVERTERRVPVSLFTCDLQVPPSAFRLRSTACRPGAGWGRLPQHNRFLMRRLWDYVADGEAAPLGRSTPSRDALGRFFDLRSDLVAPG